MTRFAASAPVLLIVVGCLLGITIPFGKVASIAGVPSLVWAALISAGGAAVLGTVHAARARPMPLTPHYLRFFAVAAVISYALPNTLIMMSIPHLGSGLTAIMFTLSPMITTVLSRLAGLRSPRRLEYLGIAVGFAGALLVSSSRGEVSNPAEPIWVVVGLLIPVSLACGNVYRSLDWPPGADPTWLAIGSHAAAAAFLILMCVATGGAAGFQTLGAIPVVAGLQVATSAAMFVLFFRLQAVGGPVTLSQIGTVAAGLGVLIGTIVFAERYPVTVWVGLALIALGIGLTIRSIAARKPTA